MLCIKQQERSQTSSATKTKAFVGAMHKLLLCTESRNKKVDNSCAGRQVLAQLLWPTSKFVKLILLAVALPTDGISPFAVATDAEQLQTLTVRGITS